MRITFLIPVFNEAESLRELHGQITAVIASIPSPLEGEGGRRPDEGELTAVGAIGTNSTTVTSPSPPAPLPPGEKGAEYEIILVDDGSTDTSWSVICELSERDPHVRGIRFRRNFGKAAALAAGFQAMTGDVVMTLDADLQDDPDELPKFLAKLDAGFDVVNGWKERRLDPWHKVYPSKVFNGMVGFLTGLKLHDHNCGLKVLRAEAAKEIRLYGELHRFIPVLAHAKGFRVAELPVQHRARKFGHSKYGVKRFFRGFLDLLTVAFLTSYGERPQHILGGIGLAFLGVGLSGMTYLALAWLCMNVIPIWEPEPIGSRPLLAYSIAATLLGGQALTLGLLAEMIVHHSARDEDRFGVAEKTS